jgi:hypothetical protein
MSVDDAGGTFVTRARDGAGWQIATATDVDWIAEGTETGLTITSGIPPVFAAYATVVLPAAEELEQHERALLALLGAHSPKQTWWLGYLETGAATDVVFADAPRVRLYADWGYVVVAAGPEEAATWRGSDGFKGALPDLMFPADRSWLLSTLWDDDWTCIGGTDALVTGLLNDPRLGPRARRVTVDEDATPPGHRAF